MDSINFSLLADSDVASQFGKKGTCTDLTLYDKKDSDTLRTWIVPNGFPDKIQPLLQAINMSEYTILHTNTLDRFTGEQIIALDTLRRDKGIISHGFDVDHDKLLSMISGTMLENYTITEPDQLLQETLKLKPIKSESKSLCIVIDHSFEVKGAGTIILGKVTSGTVKQYDELTLLPYGNKVMVKSIQMHDDSQDSASIHARVGLSLKGVKVSEINRGDLLVSDDSIKTSNTIKMELKKSPFYTRDIAVNEMCLVCNGLQIRAAKFTSISPIEITVDKPISLPTNSICLVLKPESQSSRILGSGVV